MKFHLETPMMQAVRAMFAELGRKVDRNRPLDVYLAGGVAVHLYTGKRVTTDVDADFSYRIALTEELVADFTLDDGSKAIIYLDKTYNSTFALMHEDYLDDALPVDFGIDTLRIHVLSPVDLAISKIVRFQDHDQEDICALARHGLITADAMEARANEAVADCVIQIDPLRRNIAEAVRMVRDIENEYTLQSDSL